MIPTGYATKGDAFLMSDIKLFRTIGSTVEELEGHSVALEKSLQTLIESQLDVFLGIRFLATEYRTGKTHRGRIDTLGIDENGCPCIIEYKRSSNENVINQGLYYLDWLLDHQAEFERLVQTKYGQEIAGHIEWQRTRLICIAGNFTKYDEHAVNQINRNIELLRYVRFDSDLLLLELVNAVVATDGDDPTDGSGRRRPRTNDRTVSDQLAQANSTLNDLYEALRATLNSFGDDVQEKQLKRYVAFKRIKNFASVEIQPNQERLIVYVKVDPDSIPLTDGFTRDVRQIGHWGTGGLEITLGSLEDLAKATPYLERSYQAA